MKIIVFYKLILPFLMDVARHAHSILSVFAVTLQYLKKELSDVLHAETSIIFDGFGEACPKYPGKFATSS